MYSILNPVPAFSFLMFSSGAIVLAVTPIAGQNFTFTVSAFDGVFYSTNTLKVIIHVYLSIACQSVTCPAATSCFSASKCSKGVCMGQQAIAPATSDPSCTSLCTCAPTGRTQSGMLMNILLLILHIPV